MQNINSAITDFNREEEESISEKIAANLGISYLNLTKVPISSEVVPLFQRADLEKFHFIPYLKNGHQIKAGAVEPDEPALVAWLQGLSSTRDFAFEVAKISKSSLADGLIEFQKVSDESIAGLKPEDDYINKITDLQSIIPVIKTVPITELLEIIVYGAFKFGASDIHLEPSETEFLIRYRVDGMLEDIARLPKHTYSQLLSRVMFLSGMKMDNINKPQDGSLTVSFIDGRAVDMRISIMPSTFGESVAIRLLGREETILPLDKFGFREDALLAIKEAISHSHGMILTSGPTGSGKSSTMYSMMMYLRKQDVKIITLENPVEFKIAGIEQSPVFPGEGYEFSDGLRASLRQDPDILMVGEIRDAETAEIAVQAAMTGHLLLSTVHANSAPAVYVRLLQIGVKPFLLAGSINLIMAQRLVRRICPECAVQYDPTVEESALILKNLEPVKDKLPPDLQQKITSRIFKLVRGKGCQKCNNTGYSGRLVVIEYLVPDTTIETLIARSAPIVEFETAAIAQGMITMQQDGFTKALLGESTIEEVQRVTKS